ncbi:BF3164 family lipoprotein [Roseivirga echinicomitans]
MKNLFLFFPFLFLSACTSDTGSTEGLETMALEATVLDLNESEMILPEQLFFHDGYIVSAHRQRKNIFRVFEFESGKYLGEFGSSGNGPDEYLDIIYRSIKSSATANKIIAMEGSSSQILSIDFKGSNSEIKFERSHSIQVPLNTLFINDAIFFGDSLMIAHSNSDLMEGELFTFDLRDSSIFEFGDYSNLGDFNTNLSAIVKYELYFKKLIQHPTERLFAVLYSKYNKIRIFDLQLNLVSEGYLPDDHINQPIIRNERSVDYSNTFSYNLDVDASKDFIFGLSTGNTRSEYSAMSTDEIVKATSKVFVWNWKGELVSKLVLDQPVSLIAYHEETNSLVAVNPFIDNQLFIYPLSKLKENE